MECKKSTENRATVSTPNRRYKSSMPNAHVSFSDEVVESAQSSPAKQKTHQQKRSPASGKQSVIKGICTKLTRCVKNNERQTTRSWSADEDAKLAKLVGNAFDVARISWNLLAHQMERRSGKQCRERYINNLKPDRKKGGWSKEEDSHIRRLQAELGNQWSKIAANLPGRSDNDVKNRWHSHQRSQKRKQEKEAGPAKPSRKRAKSTSSLGSQNEQSLGSPQRDSAARSSASKETAFPHKDVQLAATNNGLTENEVALCQELLNLHDALKKTDEKFRGVAKNQVSEEDTPESSEHNSMRSQEGGPSQESSNGNRETAAKSTNTKRPADEHNHNSSLKPEQQSLAVPEHNSMMSQEGGTLQDSSNDNSETAAKSSNANRPAEEHNHNSSLKAEQQSLAVPEAYNKSDEAPASTCPSIAMISHGARTSALSQGCHHPTALSFQAPLQQHMFTLSHQQQSQQLVAAAQLLSSVNPGLAMAAIASARMQQNQLQQQQQQQQQLNNGLFHQQLSNAFQRRFNYPPPPVANLPVQGRVVANQNGESIAARLSALARSSSDVDHPHQAQGPR